MFILWIILLYFIHSERIDELREHFANTDNFGDTGEDIDTDVLNYQVSELTKNYTDIDESQQQLDTKERQMSILTAKNNELNKLAYIFKYITIISISLLILMICIFVLNFGYLAGTSGVIKRNASTLVNSVNAKILRPATKKLV